ncbi:hypothetical protein [Halorussus amylolyticus]|uniref:hypothetical protein n=1 Tax=Halorussus amylolyticus TaxID=1126242 RepID=UPI001046447E|nr:hypothetical protein [Halorussus amylolyticus]
MQTVPLSDDENYAILAEQFGDGLSSLGASDQQRVVKRLHTVLASSTPQYYIYETVEGCDELEIIREGDSLRLYCRLVMGLPQNDARYNVLFAFYVDDHGYDPSRLSHFDDAAERWLDEITDFATVQNVDAYLEEHDAKKAEFFAKRLDE